MHPEIVLSPDEALTLFEIAKGAIIAMADQLAVSKKNGKVFSSHNSMDTLSNRKYLITHSTMQGLCLENNERRETMNSYFLNMVNNTIIQSPITFKPPENTLNIEAVAKHLCESARIRVWVSDG